MQYFCEGLYEYRTANSMRKEVDILSLAYLSIDWIGGGYNAASSIQTGMNARFGDRDRLLFHNFVDGYTIHVRHLVEFIYADNPAIGENHCSCFQTSFASILVCGNSGCKSDTGTAAANCLRIGASRRVREVLPVSQSECYVTLREWLSGFRLFLPARGGSARQALP